MTPHFRALEELHTDPAVGALGIPGPTGWPPNAETVMTWGKDGEAVSKFADPTWDFSHSSGKPLVLNFGDGPQRKGIPAITETNAQLLRKLTAWFLLGPRAVREYTTLKAKFKLIRPIFLHCSQLGIDATDLHRFPAVIESLATVLSPSRHDELIALLHGLFEQRDLIGFFILNQPGIARLAQLKAPHHKRQTPYIPPRIWSHVVDRCREFIDDCEAHLPQIEACFHYCLDRYMDAAGSPGRLFASHLDHQSRPFSPRDPDGRFIDIAERFGIGGLLDKWVGLGATTSDLDRGIRALSHYLGMAGYAGTLYLVAFTLMRIEEAWNLRSNCIKSHHDELLGEVILVEGRTTKTVKDPCAVWVTSPSTVHAVTVMSAISRLRMTAGAADPAVTSSSEDIENPYLVSRAYEPWTTRKSAAGDVSVRPTPLSLEATVRMYPRLLDPVEMLIRPEDIEVARRVSPTLDNEKFVVGTPWRLAWHQFRRTGAVNMFASGTVSEFAVQHQLKHSTLQMTHYYGQGFSDLALDPDTQAEVLRTMYEMNAKDVLEALDPRFVSAYGNDRKVQAFAAVTRNELKDLRKLAKRGGIPWRETPFGGCTKGGPCEYGGFDNLIRCGGGDGEPPCARGLLDKAKRPKVEELGRRIALQLNDCPQDSPLASWLQDMSASLTNFTAIMRDDA